MQYQGSMVNRSQKDPGVSPPQKGVISSGCKYKITDEKICR